MLLCYLTKEDEKWIHEFFKYNSAKAVTKDWPGILTLLSDPIFYFFRDVNRYATCIIK